MKEWKLTQTKEINRFNAWLESQVVDACASLDKCADESHTTDILEDRILQLRRMKDSLPKYLLSNANGTLLSPPTCSAIDDSMIRIPEGFSIGITAWHERSKRAVTLVERRLGDGWLCQPLNGDRVFYEHSKFLLPNSLSS